MVAKEDPSFYWIVTTKSLYYKNQFSNQTILDCSKNPRRGAEFLTSQNNWDLISKNSNESLKDVSPMRSTVVESNDLQYPISNVSKDAKSSSKSTLAFVQLELKRFRVSHIMKWSKFNVEQRTKMNYSETSVQCAQQLQSPTICNSTCSTSPTTQNRLRRLLSRFPSWNSRGLESLTS